PPTTGRTTTTQTTTTRTTRTTESWPLRPVRELSSPRPAGLILARQPQGCQRAPGPSPAGDPTPGITQGEHHEPPQRPHRRRRPRRPEPRRDRRCRRRSVQPCRAGNARPHGRAVLDLVGVLDPVVDRPLVRPLVLDPHGQPLAV